jgi:uncharacterized protein
VSGERDLDLLLASMEPVLVEGRFVFCTAPQAPEGLYPVVTVREPEGTTMVLEHDEADRAGLAYSYVAAMITLRVHSALDAVGLTAAVATELAAHGLSCNVVAGFFHDHLFVGYDDRRPAVGLLEALAERAATG